VVEQDCRLLQDLEISIICTGPISILFDRWQISCRQYRPGTASTSNACPQFFASRGGLRRQQEHLLTAVQIDRICHFSGGLLRDLITLGRVAAEEAYVSNADLIRDEDVARAARQLGESYLRGLGSQHHKPLRQLGNGEGFDITKPLAQELLASCSSGRRVFRNWVRSSPISVHGHGGDRS
jgi:hypothetical protein